MAGVKSDSVAVFAFGALTGGIIALTIGLVISKHEINIIQRDAVEAGSAEYYIDDDFNRSFRWKGPKCKPGSASS